MPSKKQNKISGQFAVRHIKMLESPAYRVLSLSAHRVMARIEIEFARHGGEDNGKLPVTFEHFVEYGMDRHAVAPAIRELSALGFIEITEAGRSGNNELRRPNKFRLTFRHCVGRMGDGTHEWRLIDTIEKAQALADAARKPPPKKKFPVGVSRQAQCGKPPLISEFPVGFSPTTGAGFSPTTYISRDIVEGEPTPPLRPPTPPRRAYGSTKANMPLPPVPMAA
jgi:hypothetical protein